MVVLKTVFFLQSTQMQCLHSMFFFFFSNTLLLSKLAYLLIMLGRLNARARFRAIADASIPLNSFSLGETSSSVDRELQPVKNLIYYFVLFYKMLNFFFVTVKLVFESKPTLTHIHRPRPHLFDHLEYICSIWP